MLNLQSPRVRVAAIAIGALFVAASTQLDWIKQVKNKPFLDAREYGFNSTASGAANRTALAAAVAAVTLDTEGSYRGKIFIPAGTYHVAGTVTITGTGIDIGGAGSNVTVILQDTANVSTFVWDGGAGQIGGSLHDLFIYNGTTSTTAGPNVYLASTIGFQMYNFVSSGGYGGVLVGGSNRSSQTHIYSSALNNSYAYNLSLRDSCGDVFLSDIMMGGSGVGNGIELRWVSGLWATSSDIYGLGAAIAITPQAGESVVNVFFDQYCLDTSTYQGLFVAPSGGGKVDSVYFNNSWISYNGRYNADDGAYIDATGGEVYDFAFNAGRIVTNGGSGIKFNGPVANIHLADNEIGANSLTVPGTAYGVILGVNVSDAHILNNRIGQPVLNTTNTTQQKRGLFAYGTDYMEIRGNTFLGDLEAAIDYGSSGTHNVIKDNPGNNPSGSYPITVTASPFTYTAGPSPEVVYISGTITSATRSGYRACPAITAGTCTVILPSNGTVVVTYASTAPTMVKDIQ